MSVPNAQVGEWVVALESHFGWSFSVLTKGELYLVEGVSTHNYEAGSPHASLSVAGTSYGDTWFRRATAKEIGERLRAVYKRLENHDDARKLWFGEKEKAEEPLNWTADTITLLEATE